MCLFGAVSEFVKSDLGEHFVKFVLHIVLSTYANQNPLAGIDLYKMGRNLDRSDLTELWLRVQITSDGVVKEKCLWQEFRG